MVGSSFSDAVPCWAKDRSLVHVIRHVTCHNLNVRFRWSKPRIVEFRVFVAFLADWQNEAELTHGLHVHMTTDLRSLATAENPTILFVEITPSMLRPKLRLGAAIA